MPQPYPANVPGQPRNPNDPGYHPGLDPNQNPEINPTERPARIDPNMPEIEQPAPNPAEPQPGVNQPLR